ncbi:MAG: TraI domain-containing protein [Gammaproteobacteria bacterium]|nr:TraI domain-containing protein [Gammaproteobacteria bacterium]
MTASPLSPTAFAVLDPETLLASHTHRLIQIRQQVGVPAAHWTMLYERLLLDFAAFVQMLPASEAHHHCEAGGLLQHCLDTTLRALTIRRGVLLPAAAGTEQLAEKQDVWTYATATAALLHDLGKPVVDQTVTLFAADGRPLGRWNPLAGPMPAQATYAVEFVRGRRYRLHPRLPPLLVQFIVPPVGLEWISSDLDVFEAWLATISGGDSELAGELGRIVRQADSASVAEDLALGIAKAPTPRRGPRPLGERLGIALRHLIDTQSLPLNRPGAAGWVFDEDLWLVSKRVLDALREELARESGGAGLPRNERLMDELQQSGIVVPNGDRAIWTATIELGEWRQRLTMLRVPLARLWTDPASRPPAVDGRAIPETDTAAEGHPDVLAAMPVQVASATDKRSPAFTETTEVELGDQATASVHADPDHEVASAPAPLEDDFLHWVSDGVRSGSLKVNTVDARVHVTQEGLLLVSPGIFRDYAGVDGWAAAQKKLQKLKLHLKTPEGTNIWTYRVSGERRSSAQLKGLLFPNATVLFGLTLPEPNPHLALAKPLNYTEAAPDGP